MDASGGMRLVTDSEEQQQVVLVKEELSIPEEPGQSNDLTDSLVGEVAEETETFEECDSIFMCSLCGHMFGLWEEVEAHVKEHGDQTDGPEEFVLITTEDSLDEVESSVVSDQ